ncbi:uncharacterized protein LOC112568648 [Pomacea canaliculata]|uniref:uncharacterized protein LOC112568648 n=1 Tax=Pomacea canaliculata TaxID=400727 RepID=UPI000D731E09|nr:uncharacterized protein LOC112568648 [Pomacea canaliculata]
MHSAHDVYRLNTTFTCSLTGQPPDLKLSVVMFNVSDSEEGEWHLELSNDSGNTSTRFSLHTEKKPGDESSSSADKVYIMWAVGCFLLLCVAIIVVFLLRRAKHKADTTLRHNVDSNKKKPLKPVLSEDMIINEVYESAGDYPMSYTTLGNESTELSGNSEGEYVYAHTAKIVTWKEQNPSNTAAGNSGEGDNVYAKVQKGDRNTPSNKGDNLYAEVQKGDKNTPLAKKTTPQPRIT